MSAEIKTGQQAPPIKEFRQLPHTETRSHVQILNAGEPVRRHDIDILVPRIIQEGFIVDQSHVNEMREDLVGPLGQRGPVQLRARLGEDGQEVHDIIDGFHRIQAMGELGWENVRANVFYNMPDQMFYDARIKDTTVKSVTWPRIAEWVVTQWKETEWAKAGIKASEAYGSIAKESTESGAASSQAQTDDENQMKKWLRERVGIWKRSPKYIADILKIVEVTDPEIISQVRVAENGRGEMDKLTPSRLGAIVDALPGEKNYIYQNVLVEVVLKLRLSATDAAHLSYRLKNAIESGVKISNLGEYTTKLAGDVLETKRRINKPVIEDGPGEVDSEDISPTERQTVLAARDLLVSLGADRFNSGRPLQEGTVTSVRKNTNTESGEGTPEKPRRRVNGWWERRDDLSGDEKHTMREVFGYGVPIATFAERYSRTPQQVVDTIIEALVKHQEAYNNGQRD